MPAIVTGPSSTPPTTIIREAIAYVRARRMVVIASHHPGVICTSGATSGLATWEPDDRADGLSPIGAAILMAQPQTIDDEDAAVIAIGAPIAYIEGYEDGLTITEPVEARKQAVERRQYLAGFQDGLMTRGWLDRKAGAVVLPGEGLVS